MKGSILNYEESYMKMNNNINIRYRVGLLYIKITIFQIFIEDS
jgi:hypothetical protein